MPAPAPPSSCVVLVPVGGGGLDPGCDDALRELEKLGHPVWRVRGYAAVDAARNQMASRPLALDFAVTRRTSPDVYRTQHVDAEFVPDAPAL